MPSILHEALLLLFCDRPMLAPELLKEALGMSVPEYDEVRIESADLTDVAPVEYRADLVVSLVSGKPVLAIAVEVQLARDAQKLYTWPAYLTELRARFKCDAAVLVVTFSASIARWAARPFLLGPGSTMTPLVVGPDAIPVITDVEQAIESPELALLSVLAHGKGEVAQAVGIATAATVGAQAAHAGSFVVYSDLIQFALSDAARKAFQMFAEGYVVQTEVGRQLAANAAEHILTVLDARHVTVSPAQAERIRACLRPMVLERWLCSAAVANSIDDDSTRPNASSGTRR